MSRKSYEREERALRVFFARRAVNTAMRALHRLALRVGVARVEGEAVAWMAAQGSGSR